MSAALCAALPADVPAEVVPMAAPAAWLGAVEAADYRCQCEGRCGRSHRKHGGRCEKTLRGLAAERLFAVPAAPGSAEAVALCGRCADGYRTEDRREQTAAAAQRAAEAPSLFDLV